MKIALLYGQKNKTIIDDKVVKVSNFVEHFTILSQICIKNNLTNFIFSSTGSVYGNLSSKNFLENCNFCTIHITFLKIKKMEKPIPDINKNMKTLKRYRLYTFYLLLL